MLGEAIRHYRNKKNMTQQELAKLIPCSVDSIRRWEANAREPRTSDLQRLCEVFGCTEAELLNGTAKQEFEVKILMGVKSLTGLAGAEVLDNTFFYGVDDGKPQIHIAGRVNIGTPEERKNALNEIIKKFNAACWMFDHKGNAEENDSKENLSINNSGA